MEYKNSQFVLNIWQSQFQGIKSQVIHNGYGWKCVCVDNTCIIKSVSIAPYFISFCSYLLFCFLFFVCQPYNYICCLSDPRRSPFLALWVVAYERSDSITVYTVLVRAVSTIAAAECTVGIYKGRQ